MTSVAPRFVCPRCGSAADAPGSCTRDGEPLADATGDDVLGSDVGGYRVVEQIGHGGMGAVYRACQPQIDAEVAIKVLARELVGDRESSERFIAEARIANRVRHEGLVKIINVGILPDGRPYQIMEHLTGAPLSRAIHGGEPLPLGTLCQGLAEALRAIGALHAREIIHRDLKPSNLFVTTAGFLKVLDFGIAKLASEQSTLTQTGQTIGTPEYMSPEQAEALELDARTDIFSMGVVLYEAVARARPFAGRFVEALAKRESPPPLAERIADVPPALDAIIAKAMAHAPSDRYAAADAMADALDDVAKTLPASAFGSLLPKVDVAPPPAPTTAQPTTVDARELPATAPLGPTPVATPEKLGRYLVERTVGRGGGGVVLVGVDPKVQRKVALKLLREGDPDRSKRLVAEAQAMARVSHPNVVTLYELGEDAGRMFLAMEYLDAIDLERWLAETSRSWSEIVAMFVEAGRGLAAAHAAGVVHRDFKPANVLLGKHGRPKVGDFGIANADAGEGTAAFMPPEQFEGGTLDPRSDQFAFCASLWSALHGEPPYGTGPALTIALAAQRGELRAPANDRVPDAINRVLARGLSPAPGDRFASMEALLDELVTPRKKKWPLLVGAGLLAVGVTATVIATRDSKPTVRALTLAEIRALPEPGDQLRAIAKLPDLATNTAARELAAEAAARGPSRVIALDVAPEAVEISPAGTDLVIVTANEIRVRHLATGVETKFSRPNGVVAERWFFDDRAGELRVKLSDGVMHASLRDRQWSYATRCVEALSPGFPSVTSWDLRYLGCPGRSLTTLSSIDRTWNLPGDSQITFAARGARAYVIGSDGTSLSVYDLGAATDSAIASRVIPRDARLVGTEDLLAIAAGGAIDFWNPTTGESCRSPDAGVLTSIALTSGTFPVATVTRGDGVVAFYRVEDIGTTLRCDIDDVYRAIPARGPFVAASHRLLEVRPNELIVRDLAVAASWRRGGAPGAISASVDGSVIALTDARAVRIWHVALDHPTTSHSTRRLGLGYDRRSFITHDHLAARVRIHELDGTLRDEIAAPAKGELLAHHGAAIAVSMKNVLWTWVPGNTPREIDLGKRVSWFGDHAGVRYAVLEEGLREVDPIDLTIKPTGPAKMAHSFIRVDDQNRVCGAGNYRMLAVRGPQVLLDDAGDLVICDRTTGKLTPLQRPDLRGGNTLWHFSDNGSALSAIANNKLAVFDDGHPRPLPRELETKPQSAMFDAKGRRIMVRASEAIYLSDERGTVALPASRDSTAASISLDGTIVAAVISGTLFVWRLDGDLTPRAIGRPYEANRLAHAPDLIMLDGIVAVRQPVPLGVDVALWPLTAPTAEQIRTWAKLVD